MSVHTYDRTTVGEGTTINSASIVVSAMKEARSTSATELGKNSRCTSHAIVSAPEGTDREMEDVTVLAGPGAQAEMAARMISDGDRVTELVSAARGAEKV